MLPTARQLAKTTKGIYKGTSKTYMNNIYKDYYSSNSWDNIWAGYGIGDCNVNKILRRWGFKDKKISSPNANSNKSYDTITPPKRYHYKHVDKITNFSASNDALSIDKDLFKVGKSASFRSVNGKKWLRRMAKRDIDLSTTRKKVVYTLIKTALKEGLVMEASLPSLRELQS